MSAEQIVRLFYDGTVYSFERAYEHSPFTFGGPFEGTQRFSRGPRADPPLHMVASLSLGRIPKLGKRYGFQPELPLIYGFIYSGCEIKYRMKITGTIEILKLSPTTSCDDFPYKNYPPILPYVPLKISEPRRCTYSKFVEEIPNMAEKQPAELIVAVPPPATLGFSLWGPMGDAEGVVVVFECSVADRTVRAYNVCT
jgi:hypothetical protein